MVLQIAAVKVSMQRFGMAEVAGYVECGIVAAQLAGGRFHVVVAARRQV